MISNPISKDEYEKTVEQILSGNFSSPNILYVGTTVRILKMLESIADDGSGGSSPSNNREYSGIFIKDGVSNIQKGDVGNPWKGNVSSKGNTNYHSHPSGKIRKVIKNESYTASWQQPPSKQDITTAKHTEYVIGMGKMLIYRYDRKGVNAVFPISIFR